jgi:hypothetical protein
MVTQRLLLEEWHAYRHDMMPATASAVQVRDTKRAFYAGAMAYQTVLNRNLARYPDDQQADMDLLADLDNEMSAFKKEVEQGFA